MNMTILDNIPFNIDMKQLLDIIRIEEDDEDFEIVKRLVSQAESIGKPKAVYSEAYINEKGEDFVVVDSVTFTSRVLRVNLGSVYKVYPFVVTCGAELETWSAAIDDMFQHYWADSIKELALYSAIESVYAHMKETYPIGNISTMNPGSLEDWPIKEQPHLFNLLGDVHKAIGVELTESYLMLPVKSVSGIAFPSETGFESCQLCPREHCPGRRAPYDTDLFNSRYGK